MVGKSNVGWSEHCKGVEEELTTRYGERKAKMFMDYYHESYDHQQRSSLHWKVAFHLFDMMMLTKKRNGHYWITIIGKKGGEGKSTLAKNLAYFLNNKFTSKEIARNTDQLVLVYNKLPRWSSVLLDEPQLTIHPSSKEGRSLRQLMTKVRARNAFVILVANDVKEIDGAFKDRITGFIYMKNFKYWFWDNERDFGMGNVVDEIISDWQKVGRSGLLKPKLYNRCYLKNITSSMVIPFDDTEYADKKAKDIDSDFEEHIKTYIHKDKGRRSTETEKKIKKIKNILKKNPKIKQNEVAKKLRVSYSHLARLKSHFLWDEIEAD